MSRNLPRRHSFATDFAEKAQKEEGGKVKKGGGRFRRLRKVSFHGDSSNKSKSPQASPDPAARSLSTGDKPLGFPLAGILKQKGNNSPPAVQEDASPKVIQDCIQVFSLCEFFVYLWCPGP